MSFLRHLCMSLVCLFVCYYHGLKSVASGMGRFRESTHMLAFWRQNSYHCSEWPIKPASPTKEYRLGPQSESFVCWFVCEWRSLSLHVQWDDMSPVYLSENKWHLPSRCIKSFPLSSFERLVDQTTGTLEFHTTNYDCPARTESWDGRNPNGKSQWASQAKYISSSVESIQEFRTLNIHIKLSHSLQWNEKQPRWPTIRRSREPNKWMSRSHLISSLLADF